MTTTHRITTTAVLILSLAAAGAPAARRRLSRQANRSCLTANRAPAAVYSRQDKSVIAVTTPSTTAGIARR